MLQAFEGDEKYSQAIRQEQERSRFKIQEEDLRKSRNKTGTTELNPLAQSVPVPVQVPAPPKKNIFRRTKKTVSVPVPVPSKKTKFGRKKTVSQQVFHELRPTELNLREPRTLTRQQLFMIKREKNKKRQAEVRRFANTPSGQAVLDLIKHEGMDEKQIYELSKASDILSRVVPEKNLQTPEDLIQALIYYRQAKANLIEKKNRQIEQNKKNRQNRINKIRSEISSLGENYLPNKEDLIPNSHTEWNENGIIMKK